MIQIIEEKRRPNRGQQLGAGIKGALSSLAGSYVEKLRGEEQQQAFQKENEQAKRLGIDLEGITDPRMRQEAFKLAMQGQNQSKLEQIRHQGISSRQQELEILRQKGKKDLMSEKQNFLSQLLGGNEAQLIQGQQGMGQNQQMQGQQAANGFDVTQLSDEDLARAASIDPNMGRALSHAKDVALREKTEARKEKNKILATGHKRAEKTLDKADALGQEIPILESSISAMEDAVVNGDQSFWSLDNLAEMTGLELFRTAKGGQFKTAAKTYFINDLKSSGARPNQFIEKQLADALARVGRSKEANQTVIESFKFSNDLKKKWHESVRFLEDLYTAEGGYLPGNFSSQVEKIMDPYIKTRQKQYENKLHELSEQEKRGTKKSLATKETGPIRMRTPPSNEFPEGEEIFVPEEDLEEALSLGAMRA